MNVASGEHNTGPSLFCLSFRDKKQDSLICDSKKRSIRSKDSFEQDLSDLKVKQMVQASY